MESQDKADNGKRKIEKAQKSGKSCHNMFVKLRSHDYLAIKGLPIVKSFYKKNLINFIKFSCLKPFSVNRIFAKYFFIYNYA